MSETYECPKCNNRLTLPLEIDAEDREAIVRVFRSGGKIDTMIVIRERLNLGLLESKIMTAHMVERKDHCRCGGKLLEEGITYCPSCSGLNFNW